MNNANHSYLPDFANMSPNLAVIFLIFLTKGTQSAEPDFGIVSTTQRPTEDKNFHDHSLKIDLNCTTQNNNDQKNFLQVLERLDKLNNNINRLQEQMVNHEKKLEEELNSKINSSLHLLQAQISAKLETDNQKNKAIMGRDCKEIQKKNFLSGVYLIQPEGSPEPFDVFCDMETEGGGWAYILNRFDGSQNFDLNWTDYKNGFGNLSGEFWIGLEHLYQMTGKQHNELYIELTSKEMVTKKAHYQKFSLGNEGQGYSIQVVEGYSGDEGDYFQNHKGYKFSTKDRDQDQKDSENCAAEHGGGWWFRNCYWCLFTGTEKDKKPKIQCGSFQGYGINLKQAKMMVRPNP